MDGFAGRRSTRRPAWDRGLEAVDRHLARAVAGDADLDVQARITGTDWTEYLVVRLKHGSEPAVEKVAIRAPQKLVRPAISAQHIAAVAAIEAALYLRAR